MQHQSISDFDLMRDCFLVHRAFLSLTSHSIKNTVALGAS